MMDAGERELFTKAVETADARGGDLDAALADLCWTDALVEDEHTAVSALFEAQGRAGVTSSALDAVLARALGAAAGAAVLLPSLGSTKAPGTVQGDAIKAAGLATSMPSDGALLVASDVGIATIAVDGLTCRPIEGLDPQLGLVEISGSAAARSTAPAAWDDAVAVGQRALAHQLVGASAQLLELAREHALDRIQFGVPIASFQAIRHKLADTYVAIESSRTALDAAWEEPSTFNAAVAQALAGRAARLAATHCQQVLAGIGFTTEHPLHTYVRRVRVLDGLLGDRRTLTQAIGAQLLEAGGLPAILPLV
jgi:hypothetical protein